MLLAAAEAICRIGHLPIPGAVVALVLLYGNLLLLRRIPEALGALADRVLSLFGLFFVPAGVGVVAYWPLLRADLPGILAALVGGTITTIAVTAVVAERLGRPKHTQEAADVGR